MISYRTKRSHARSRINRIFSRVVFLERKLVCQSFPLCLYGAGYRQSRATLNGNPKGRTTSKKWVFLCRQSFTPPKNLSGKKIFCSLSWFSVLIGNYSVFPSIFFLLLSSDLRSGILLFLFFSFFSFLPFRSLIGNSGFNIRYSLSLEEIMPSFSPGERIRILFMGQGSK